MSSLFNNTQSNILKIYFKHPVYASVHHRYTSTKYLKLHLTFQYDYLTEDLITISLAYFLTRGDRNPLSQTKPEKKTEINELINASQTKKSPV